jgi:hypothetical protein
VEPLRGVRVAGLLSKTEPSNCRWMAPHAGHGSPDAMRRPERVALAVPAIRRLLTALLIHPHHSSPTCCAGR